MSEGATDDVFVRVESAVKPAMVRRIPDALPDREPVEQLAGLTENVRESLREHGSTAFARDQMRRLVEDASQAIESLPDSPERWRFREFCPDLVERDTDR